MRGLGGVVWLSGGFWSLNLRDFWSNRAVAQVNAALAGIEVMTFGGVDHLLCTASSPLDAHIEQPPYGQNAGRQYAGKSGWIEAPIQEPGVCGCWSA